MDTAGNLRTWLADSIAAGAAFGRAGYVYGYPHKKAYRPLPAPVPLRQAWAGEDRSALFCYVHVPFCRQRCSFCNLFAFVPGGSPAAAYLDALACEMEGYAQALGAFRFRRLYVGGGTPTFLTGDELTRLAALLQGILGAGPAQSEGCIEASPETLDEDKTALLRGLGFARLSLGVQSLVAGELRQVNRRFDFSLNRRAIDAAGRAGFPHFNIDLIYGLPGQTGASWRYSLDCALDSAATSLFLYPLYVRPLTGLDHRPGGDCCPTPAQMAAWYDLAVERLDAAGFRQVTMRQFRRDPPSPGCGGDDLEYRCQHDGMVGLGAGARSYTRRLHYSTPWKMVARNIRDVVAHYGRAMAEGDTDVRHGFILDKDEQRRRYVILSLLYDGVDLEDFTTTFGADARPCFAPQWEALEAEGCVYFTPGRVCLTARGVRHADLVGQVFFSETARRLADAYEYDA
jgi:oxygen-independent coproporphyrinogen-3 oxidase